MNALFLKVVNMSISAGWLVLAVLLLRLLLRKAPKWIMVLLWGVVAIRLVCPFSIESMLSLIPSAETVSPQIMVEKTPTIDTGIPIINNTINPVISGSFSPKPAENTNPLQIWIPLLAAIWAVGAALLVAYTAISYWRVRRRVGTAILLRENIYQSETVISPFVLGIIKPKIYLPFHMQVQDMEHVIAHEQAHIRRKDHWWKPFGFLLLTLYWFNPLIWLGYILLCRDIELACDEKVVKTLTREQRAEYSEALLNCSVNRRILAACPLAFGEVGVKGRVKSVLHYKKPAFWIILVALIASIAVAVCFLTDPIAANKHDLLLAVLNSEKTFINESGEAVYLKDRNDIIPKQYAFVDFDRDGTNELVVYVTPSYGAYIVFHIYNGNVYGFEFVERALIDLKEDGTFVGSEGAGIHSYLTLRFEKTKYKEIELAYKNDMDNEYRLNGKKATAESVTAYCEEFENKTRVTWENCNPSEDMQSPELEHPFISILTDNQSFYCASNKLEIRISDYQREIWLYALADLDQDGTQELAIMWTDGNILILRQNENSIAGFDFGLRSLYQLNQDGTFYWSEDTGLTYGCSALQFSGNQCSIQEIWRVEHGSLNTITYYLGNSPVNEYTFLVNTQTPKQSVAWIDWAEHPLQSVAN